MLQLERLEDRTLLTATPRVIGCLADNRGEVVIALNRSLKDTTVTRQSVQVYTSGADGVLGNTDDIKMIAPVFWNGLGRKITIKSHGISAGVGYRVRLIAKKLITPDGTHLDGEFTGAFPSGNGVPFGNFEFQSKNDKSANPLVRMSTNHGVITIKMFRDKAPISVANFFNYANSGRYPGSSCRPDRCR